MPRLNRPPPEPTALPRKVREHVQTQLGVVHIDLQHLRKLRTANGEMRKYVFYAGLGQFTEPES